MTVEEIRQSGETFLRADDIAAVMGLHPQSIRKQAAEEPRKLGFPVSVIGTRVLIPRVPFLRFIGEEVKT